jgi:hypothetical protein
MINVNSNLYNFIQSPVVMLSSCLNIFLNVKGAPVSEGGEISRVQYSHSAVCVLKYSYNRKSLLRFHDITVILMMKKFYEQVPV